MPYIGIDKIKELQKSNYFTRNICILAHVDHGKTTLADSLIASNGIISQKLAGKLRYMDSREDEQIRGITMKSSSISLHYKGYIFQNDFLINLIDSPGHVDFASEVSTAVRLCDGAIVVVDVVEGVCAQTRVWLQQAYQEQLKPILVLNKIDRLILEKQMTPLDAYYHLMQLLEQINAVMGNIFASDVMANEVKTSDNDCISALEDSDDSNIYFCPTKLNVIFASAIDGWAFILSDFAQMYESKLGREHSGIRKEQLINVLWGDFFYSTKDKFYKSGAQEHGRKPMFVQFVLENIWALYETIVVRKDKPKIPVIAEKLGIKLTARDLRHTDGKIQLQAVMAQWLPLSRAVLEQICRFVKTCQVSAEKAERLMCSLNQNFASFPPKTQELKLEFQKSSYASKHVIVFISKMFPIKRGQLPEYKSKILTQRKLDHLRKKTEIALAQMNVSAENPVNEDKIVTIVDELAAPDEAADENEEDEDIFIAFSRVYSGTLKRGMKIYVLGPKHDPRTIDPDNPLSSPYVSEIEVENLYILMGRELEPIDEVPAGNIVGISGLQNHILKNGTLSNNIYCPPFTDLTLTATPILRVSVEPQSTVDMPKLVKGLKLLNQADACVKVIMQETGELVLVTLGEVHLERCIKDLEETFAKIKINVSEPIVPFRETIVPKSTVDMVNEAITESVDNIEEKIIEFSTRNKQCHARILAIPLPDSITTALEDQSDILKALSNLQETKSLPEHTLRLLEQFKENLRNLFVAEKSEFFDETTVDKIWSLGPRKIGPNILLNLTDDYKNPKFWNATVENQATSNEIVSDKRTVYEHSFVHGFQLASLTGPLCAEPLRGVCFIVYSWTYDDTIDSNEQLYGPLSGQIVSAVKEGCRKAFEKQPQRLVTPMYSCNIVVRSEALGNMYGIISRRHGRILAADLIGGSGSFSVTAVIPIIESYNFSQEFRTKTSGLAYPQLVFGHWEVVDIDPFWVPSTEEEYTHFGEKADTANRAKVYMDSVRKRKGLLVQEKTVEHAEKQRTLGKNK